jgi:Flp pilus assembly protein protease CpaA
MGYLHILFSLIGIVLLGVITSYTDIKDRRIRNKHVLLGALYGLALALIFLLPNYEILLHYFIGAIAALISGVILWHLKFWTAGDAKLFTAIVMMTPPFTLFTAIPIFINTLMPIFVFLIVIMLIRLRYEYIKDAVLDTLNFKKMGKSIIGLFSIMWLVGFTLNYLGVHFTFAIQLVIIISIYMIVMKILGRFSIYAMITITILRLIFDKSIFSYSFMIQYAIILITFVIVRNFIIEISEETFRKKVKIKDLKKGMVPVDKLVIYNEKKKQQIVEILTGTRGLSDAQVITLKGASHKGMFKQKHVYVQETLPFAPFILLGVLITFILRGHGIILF